MKLSHTWQDGDQITLQLPMQLDVRRWEKNKHSVSVNYSPLTFSFLINERYVRQDSKETAIHDSQWQEKADPQKWPSYEIYPASDLNYGLVLDGGKPEKSFKIVRKDWQAGDNPFTNGTAPIHLQAQGRRIAAWTVDQHGLCGVLPASPVPSYEPLTP